MTTNQGSSGTSKSRTISNLPFADGTVLVNVLNSGTSLTVQGGSVTVSLPDGHPFVGTVKS